MEETPLFVHVSTIGLMPKNVIPLLSMIESQIESLCEVRISYTFGIQLILHLEGK